MKYLKEVRDKFKFNETLIKNFNHWDWIIRPEQITLGSTVLLSKVEILDISKLSPEAFTELHEIVRLIDLKLQIFNPYRINYLSLSMIDPVVHFHVIPRYENVIIFKGKSYKDFGFPGPPDFKRSNSVDSNLILELKSIFN